MKRIFTLFFAGVSICAAAQNSPYISKVYDFLPAPGQFVNELPEYMDGDSHEAILAKVEEQICGDKDPGMISLGGFGGYVVFGFDHPVANVEGAYDFKIYANAFMAAGSSVGGSCEPGIVMVSVDANGNGLADDEWYELAGSDYGKETTIKNYSLTYYKPDADKTPTPEGMMTDTTYIRWTSSEGDEGYVMKNSFHNQSYWPEWYEGETMEFVGTKLADNAFDQSGNGTYYVLTRLDWGYVDNYANDIDEGFKIDWAVDAEGNPKHLTHIDFVKVYTAVNQYCGWIGETSTEVCGAEDLHPDAEVVGVDAVDADDDVLTLMASNAYGVALRNGGEAMEAQIYSVSGGIVKQTVLASGDNLIDVASLPKGVYIIRAGRKAIKFAK